MADRHHVYDEQADLHRIAGLTSQPAVYQDPDQPEYDKTWPDPDTQLHTVVPGSTTPPAVSDSGVDLGAAPPAPLQDVGVSADGVPGHAANTTPADGPFPGGKVWEGEPQPTDPDGTPIRTPDALASGETPVEPSTGDEPVGATTADDPTAATDAASPEEADQQ